MKTIIINSHVSIINFLHIPYDLQLQTLQWRNAPCVARYFKIPRISLETHKKWLDSLAAQPPKTIAFMIKYDEQCIGVTYFHSIDYTSQRADWGMYIYREDFRGKGIGADVLSTLLDYATDKLNLKTVFLDVLSSNTHAVKLYEKCGFRAVANEENSFVRYRRDL